MFGVETFPEIVRNLNFSSKDLLSSQFKKVIDMTSSYFKALKEK
jgi:hypothetical protein